MINSQSSMECYVFGIEQEILSLQQSPSSGAQIQHCGFLKPIFQSILDAQRFFQTYNPGVRFDDSNVWKSENLFRRPSERDNETITTETSSTTATTTRTATGWKSDLNSLQYRWNLHHYAEQSLTLLPQHYSQTSHIGIVKQIDIGDQKSVFSIRHLIDIANRSYPTPKRLDKFSESEIESSQEISYEHFREEQQEDLITTRRTRRRVRNVHERMVKEERATEKTDKTETNENGILSLIHEQPERQNEEEDLPLIDTTHADFWKLYTVSIDRATKKWKYVLKKKIT